MRKAITTAILVVLALVALGLTTAPSRQKDSLTVTAYFNKNRDGDPLRSAIIETVNNNEGDLRIAVRDFTDSDLKDFLITQEQERDIKIILMQEGRSKYEKDVCDALNPLSNITVRYLSGIHHKFLIVGKSTVLTGSANWSNNSLNPKKEANNLVVIESEKIADAFIQEFNQLWESDRNEPGCY